MACREGRIDAFGRLIACAGLRNIPQNVEFLIDYLAEMGCRAEKYSDSSFDGINPSRWARRVSARGEVGTVRAVLPGRVAGKNYEIP